MIKCIYMQISPLQQSFRLLSIHHMHFRVQMVGQIFQFVSHACQQGFNLDTFPTKHPGEKRIAIYRHSLEHIELMVLSEFLEFGVSGPRTLRELAAMSVPRCVATQ